ncbi:putative ribonuclease H-like domain-containing protein [Tanacetum coccineum]
MNKKYCLVVTDDYSRFTCVFFLATKDETSGILKSFITEIENLVDKKVKIIRCDNGTETLIEAARTMLADSKLPTTFWAKAVNTACYVQNRVLIVKPYNKTPYELFRGRTHALSFMRPFGCHVTIFNTLDYLGKFDGKLDEGFFVGYLMNCKAFRVYNIRTRKVEENLHIRFLEDKPIIVGNGPKWLFDIDVLTKSMNYVPVNASNNEPQPSSDAGKKDDKDVCKETGIVDQEKYENSTQGVNTAGPSINTEPGMFSLGDNATLEATHANFFGDETEVDISNITTTYPVPSTLNTRIYKDHSLDHVIGDGKLMKTFILVCLLVSYPRKSPKKNNPSIKRSKLDRSYVRIAFAVQVTIGLDLGGFTTWQKSHWVTQEEGIDYDEVFALIARIDAIRLFLAYASFKDFVVYQMDVKSEFLYGKIEEEVFVCQPPGFEDLEFPDRVYKVEKALYGLHQAPRAWYETLSTYLLDNGFQRGQIDKTLFIKRVKSDILLVQVYVDDIIFGSTKKKLCTEFEKLMHKKFQMSSMVHPWRLQSYCSRMQNEDVDVHLYRSTIGSLMYLTSSRPDIMFIILERSPKLGFWYPKDSPFDLEAYTDSDYAGASLDRKSTTRGCQFLKSRLISWQCKKKTIVANSTTEAEYVAAASF